MGFKFIRTIIFTILLLTAGISLGAGIGFYVFSLPDLSEIKRLETYTPPLITKIYSSDGEVISQLYAERRIHLDLDNFSPHLTDALIATEDRKFFKHSGIYPKGILRAFIKNIATGSFAQGASTLTQQLAKTLFLSPEKKIKRKLIEIILAFQIEKKYTKNEILALYLNQVYFGSGAYGAESAALTYFNKSASELNIAEAALIAGMPKAPSYLSPLVNPKPALQRRNQVLANMLYEKKISSDQYKKFVSLPIELHRKESSVEKYSWFTSVIRQKLEDMLGYDLLYKSGLEIHTSLDSKIQNAVQSSIEKNMEHLEQRMKAKNINSKPECAVVALDVNSGKILALSGGRDYSKSKFNRALYAKRQPGSAFKPLVYALAIKEGYHQNAPLRDVPTIFNVYGKKDWRPNNFSKSFSGETTIRKALALSKNIPVIRLLETLGPKNLVTFAKTLGISSKLSPTLSLALGSYETTLIELVSAYSVFPARGFYKTPWYIEYITKSGEALFSKEDEIHKRVYPEKESAVMVDILQAVIKEGTGRSTSIKGYPLGGKTGTTDDFRDALFIGFSPSVALGVWVGCDDNSSLGYSETGAKAALPIWRDIMKFIAENKKYPEYFPLPEDIVYKKFDPDSGKIIDTDEKKGVIGIFIQ
ncbi:MAG: PBP1A family penicillin-binding protein [Desulfobacteraceae bacterium]|nr:PBP1A family penicillin-binding protein [Desulfobacteraceae bacterium]